MAENGSGQGSVRERLHYKKRVVIKIGSSSLTHPVTGNLNLHKMERLVRVLCDLRNQGLDVVLVSSGAIAAGIKVLGFTGRPGKMSLKQACAAAGQANLMMIYQKLFYEYHQISGQVLMTKYSVMDEKSRINIENTLGELIGLGVIPIVNENDTVATEEIDFGDNDSLSAIVAALIRADLLILLSDIDGLYTDDPSRNPQARFIPEVEKLSEEYLGMGKGSRSAVGTGGMSAKLSAARIAVRSGADMVIANGEDPENIYRILKGEEIGTLFLADPDPAFSLGEYL